MKLKDNEAKVFFALGSLEHGYPREFNEFEENLDLFMESWGYSRWASGTDIENAVRDIAYTKANQELGKD